jgi:hypothetical protein
MLGTIPITKITGIFVRAADSGSPARSMDILTLDALISVGCDSDSLDEVRL